MKKILLLFVLFFSISSSSQEDTSTWRIIPSITDWAKEVNNWRDSIYDVKNIKILIDVKKDSLLFEELSFPIDTIRENIAAVFNKNITVDGLEFVNDFGTQKAKVIKNLHFKGWLRIANYSSEPISGFFLKNIIVDERFSIQGTDRFSYFNFYSCEFKNMIGFFDFNQGSYFSFNNVTVKKHMQLTRTPGKPNLSIVNSNFNRITLRSSPISEVDIRNSKIDTISINSAIIERKFHLIKNNINLIELTGAQLPESNTYIPFKQVSGKLFVKAFSHLRPDPKEYMVSDAMDFELKEDYDLLISSYKSLLGSYQKRGDQESYNACYVEMKNLETRYLQFLYTKNATFKSYFTWKINQFLKVFSAYGTEPARSIIFSLYVILLFALIYLLFPNSWDSHGKKRLMHRFEFFQKYLRRNEGIHTIYLEGKEQEISSFNDFKNKLDDEKLELPAFFISWSKPLYNASMFSSKLMTRFLKTTDVLTGKWKDLTPKQKRWKNIQIGVLLILGLLYDVFIKALNALMLSINTFTTLGFGEIPIKGLPRYLAIIQGFIGWFMLTIFSVSLISQLLN